MHGQDNTISAVPQKFLNKTIKKNGKYGKLLDCLPFAIVPFFFFFAILSKSVALPTISVQKFVLSYKPTSALGKNM